jgi:two-component SAPR family response regulator
MMADEIPFNYNYPYSNVNLYYMPVSDKLYAYISNPTETSTQIKIYSINFPPESSKIESYQKEKNRFIIPFLITVAIIGVVGLIIYKVVRRNNFRKKISENLAINKNIESLESITNTNHFQNTYNLIFFGGFQVFNKQMEDITNKFSPLLKELFLLILLKTNKNGKGISTEKIIEKLWSHKTEKSARNNFAVTNAKLRSLLHEIGELELSKKTGYWKIDINENEVRCDYLELLKMTSSVKTADKQKISHVIKLTQRGAFLINLEYEWLDEFKAIVSDRIVDTLVEFGQSFETEKDPELISQLADCVTNFDIVNEEAMILKCKAQVHMHKHSLAKATFEKFCEKYEEIYGEKYNNSYKEILT